jgi:hypothetical protein
MDSERFGKLNIVEFADLLLLMNRLIGLGLISEEEKERTARRIAYENELSLLLI